MDDISNLRREYHLLKLDLQKLNPNPFEQFRKWMEDAIKYKVLDPNMMTLATSTKDGKPSARIVLLKDLDDTGFTFFTSYRSRKGNEINSNPYAALVFYWDVLERQVRVEGTIEKVTSQESDDYFKQRPYKSRLSTLVSNQSQEIPNREQLDDKFIKVQEKYLNGIISRPASWGGYRLLPSLFEFWQGREHRLHDRFEYIKEGNDWRIRRLAP
jgi:pyridoxamine 5'-phosphate oxidase